MSTMLFCIHVLALSTMLFCILLLVLFTMLFCIIPLGLSTMLFCAVLLVLSTMTLLGVQGPLMLEMGVLPDVAAASSATMILFTSASASLVYLSFGGIS